MIQGKQEKLTKAHLEIALGVEQERRLSTDRGREDEAIADEIEVRHVAAGHWRARGGR